MGRPNPVLTEKQMRAALITVLDRMMPACEGIDYRLVGTGAALLQGVQLPAADIDLLVKERNAVVAISTALAQFTCLEPPVWLPEMRQYYANYAVEGVEVGISTVEIETTADFMETYGTGLWQHYRLVACGSYRVPAVALELRLITELSRGRADRSEPLIRFLQVHGCDVDLVARGLADAGLPQTVQEEVLGRVRNLVE